MRVRLSEMLDHFLRAALNVAVIILPGGALLVSGALTRALPAAPSHRL